MQARHLLAASSLGLLAAAPAFDRIAFAPEAETTVTKSFETTLDLALDDLMVNFNGQDMDPSMMGMDMSSASMTATILVEVEDTYGEVKDGRPMQVTRLFNTVNADLEAGDGQSKSESDDDLVGTTLTFQWNEETGEYDLSADDEDLDLNEITHGGEDMDLRDFLPAGDVSDGDSWRLEGKKLTSVLWPGLNWARLQEGATERMAETEIPAELEELMADLVKKATVECTYAGTRETDGADMQVITLGGEMEHDMEVGEMILELIRASNDGNVDMDLEANLEIAAQLTGELLWDPAAGHFASCEMDIEIALLSTMEGEADVQGNPMEASAEVEVSGVLRRRATAR